MLIVMLLISFIPPLIIMGILAFRKKDKKYRKDCLTMFRNGALSALGIMALDLVITIVFNMLKLYEVSAYLTAFLKAFIINAFVEELMKCRFAIRGIKSNKIAYSFFDLMSFFAITAGGFELLEAVVYFFGTNAGQIIVRGLTSLHIMYGLTMGYFISKGKLTGQKKYNVFALLIPILLHGVYNFGLKEGVAEGFAVSTFASLGISMVIGIGLLIWMYRNRSKEEYNKILGEGKL